MIGVFGRSVSYGGACALFVVVIAWTYNGSDKGAWVLEPQEMSQLIGGNPCPHEIAVPGDCVKIEGNDPGCSYNESCTQIGVGNDPTSRCYRVEKRATTKCGTEVGNNSGKYCNLQTTENFCLRKYWGNYSIWVGGCQPCVNGDANCSENPVTTAILISCTTLP
jgi:hypothetical protein